MSCAYSDIEVIPESLEFETTEGSQFIPPSKYLYIKKAGTGRGAIWDASTEDWVNLSPKTGDTPKRVRVSVKSIGMSSGIYETTITVASHVNVTPSEIGVRLVVKPKEIEPEDPTEPEEPTEPELPDQPEEPTEPELPTEPDVPDPELPEEPSENPFVAFWNFILDLLRKIWPV